MAAVIFTKLSGWLLLPLLITTTSLPFILRRKSLLLSLGEVGAQMRPYLQRLRPHYVLGYAITGLVVAHAWVPMSAGFGGHANTLVGRQLELPAYCLTGKSYFETGCCLSRDLTLE